MQRSGATGATLGPGAPSRRVQSAERSWIGCLPWTYTDAMAWPPFLSRLLPKGEGWEDHFGDGFFWLPWKQVLPSHLTTSARFLLNKKIGSTGKFFSLGDPTSNWLFFPFRFPQAPCQPHSTTHPTHCGLLHPTAGALVPMRQGTSDSIW